MKWIKIGVFIVIFAIFVYFRITPIINQTVPYTYDQGRDFLKIEEIFRDKNITFIGPTTGIQGVYHGVWWYYFLIIPYLLFSGWPQGFYYGLFILNLIVILSFYKFLKKNYSFGTALFFLSTVSVSNFFIRSSFFASNNSLTPLFVLVLLFSLYQLFKTNKSRYLFLTGLSLGFIFETEMAFGLFIIPSFLITYLLFRKLREIIYLFPGLILPIIPRLFFELRNNFLQTRSFLDFLSSPKNTNTIQLKTAITDRLVTFWQYWTGLFYKENIFFSILFMLVLLGSFISINKKFSTKKTLVNFLLILTGLVFIFSLTNKDSFFWSYYLDGIQYVFLFLLTSVFFFIEKNKKISFTAYFLLTFIIGINLFSLKSELINKNPIPLIGLRADDTIVKYVLKKNTGKEFCLKIYTPPAFPFTYRYLLDYYTKKGSVKYPKADPVGNLCWYIIDFDNYQERVADWRKENIPETGRLIEKKMMENKTSVELWSI